MRPAAATTRRAAVHAGGEAGRGCRPISAKTLLGRAMPSSFLAAFESPDSSELILSVTVVPDARDAVDEAMHDGLAGRVEQRAEVAHGAQDAPAEALGETSPRRRRRSRRRS